MALQQHVNGTTHVWTKTAAAGTAWEQLGVSVDGISFTINQEFDEVYNDFLGPKAPFDMQSFLQNIDISLSLIWYEQNVLYRLLQGTAFAFPPGVVQTPLGVAGWAGNLVTQNFLSFPMSLVNTPANAGLTVVENCWTFPVCITVDQSEVKLGVEKSVWNLKIRALYNTYSTTTSSFGTVLFNGLCLGA